MMPTLRVVIAVHNEEEHLPEQLRALKSEWMEGCELVCVDDASTDGTDDILHEARGAFPGSLGFLNFRRQGAIASYNYGANCLSEQKDWLLLASGNDVLQPGCFAAWRRAIERFPDCRIVCGDVGRQTDPPSIAEPEHRTIAPGDPFVPGPGVFIRGDMWKAYGGYNAKLGAFCDWYLNHVIALRHGFVYFRQPMAWMRSHPNRLCEECRAPAAAAPIAAELVRLWDHPDNSDIRELWFASGLAGVAGELLGEDLRKKMEKWMARTS